MAAKQVNERILNRYKYIVKIVSIDVSSLDEKALATDLLEIADIT
jgi:ribosomal protein S10